MSKSWNSHDPIWINRIVRRVSFKKFASSLNGILAMGQDFSQVFRKNSAKHDVYEVVVETWAGDEKSIWVREELAEAAGEIFRQFLEQQLYMPTEDSYYDQSITNENTSSQQIEESDFEKYEMEEEENEAEKSDDSIVTSLSASPPIDIDQQENLFEFEKEASPHKL